MVKQRREFQTYVSHVVAMQRMARGASVRKRYKGNRDGAIKVQAIMRGALERKRFKYVHHIFGYIFCTLWCQSKMCVWVSGV